MNPKKLVRKVLPKQGIKIAEEAYRKGRVYAFQAAKGFPAKGLRVIAITGTNGKTTTACYVNEMLKSAGYKTALFSTALIEMAGKTQLNRTHRTVPVTAELVKFFEQAKKSNVDFVVMETTSQALHQHKMFGMPVEIAVMTNLTQDHLDYHKNMQNYAAAKARLFNNYMKPGKVVLNRDDEWFDYFNEQSAGEVVTYGETDGSSAKISHVKLGDKQSSWVVTEHKMELNLTTDLPGRFNVQNATAAASVGLLLGLSAAQIQKGVASLKAVPGRMEVIDEGQPFGVIVDYAHTPDALKNVLTAAKDIATRRVIAVFGATGDRDKAKRPVMGQVVAKIADKIYLTDDETYTEDGDSIRAAVREGIDNEDGIFVEIPDRLAAIKAAFDDAKKGDVVVLAGIGHQDTRNMGGKSIKWDERDVARTLLKQR